MADAMHRGRILLIAREHIARDHALTRLSRSGFELEGHTRALDALDRARADRFDLIVLDLSVPDLDAVTMCRAIRAQSANANTPMIALIRRDADRVISLESGADDCLPEPLEGRHLGALVRALLRRGDRAPAKRSVLCRHVDATEIVVDTERRRIVVRGQVAELTRREFDLLQLLASRAGVVFSRSALLSRFWSDDAAPTGRAVDTAISRLRRKIERDVERPELILTAWGIGYRFAAAERSRPDSSP